MVKLFEAATEQFLGSPECYMWNLPTLMVCLAPLRAKSIIRSLQVNSPSLEASARS